MSETTTLFVAWAASAVILILLATRVGPKATRPWNLVLSRGSRRVSLTNLQLTLWTIVVLSMLTALFVARLVDDPRTALDFEIPPELLLVMGVSATSTVLSTVVRTGDAGGGTAASTSRTPRLLDAVKTDTDDALEITRFQNFWLTIIVVVAYVTMAGATFADTELTTRFDSLPPLAGEIVALLAISHGGYLAKKTADANS